MLKKHSFVHDVRVASPCKADWDKMTGDERVRFCHACKLNVYNISEMTTDEAEKLIIEKEGRLCIRMYRRKDGTLLNMDCPIGKLTKRFNAAFGAVSAALSFCAMWLMNGRPVASTSPNLEIENGRMMIVNEVHMGKVRREPKVTVERTVPGYIMGDMAVMPEHVPARSEK
jgi:hypothetical protein